jgi:hypothetical protein
VRFIATLTPGDTSTDTNGLSGDWVAAPSDRTARVTADGRFLAFMSEASLTGYDNEKDYEIFEYDSASGRLVCASCGPAGLRPTGNSRLGAVHPLKSIFPQSHALSVDGRVFFDSLSALSPYDTNGRVQDVYEYEPDGIGTCARPAGCVFLISRGNGTSDSEFVDATPSGSDAFFVTRDRLAPQDQDDLVDLYDARVDGGFPEVTAPACTGTGCQGLPGTPPIFATPSSVTYDGVGNFAPAASERATKPKVKKRSSRCPRGGRPNHHRCVKARRGQSKTRKAGKSSHSNRRGGR